MDYLSLKNKLLKLDDQASKLRIYKGEIFASSVISLMMTYFLYMLIFEMIDKFNNGNSIVIYILVLIPLVILLSFSFYNLIKYLLVAKSLKNEKSKDKLDRINLEIKSNLKNISDEYLIKLDNEANETSFRYAVSSEIKNELIKRCSKRLNIKNKENQKNDFLYEILLNKNFKQIKIKND